MISPLLIFIASILLFSLFFFINLASGLSILLIFSKNQLFDLLIFLKGFSCLYLLQFSPILVISCLLLGFQFLDLAPPALSILMLVCQFWISPLFSCGTYCYIFSSRDCIKCVRDSGVLCLYSCWFRRISLILPSFHC